jgi:outer membrane protein assembly factor BamB
MKRPWEHRSGVCMALTLLALVGVLTLAACGGSGSTASSSPSATPSGGASSGASQQHGLVWKFKTGAAVRSSPAVSNGVVYVGSDDGCLYAVDVESGQQRWAFKTGGKVRGSPAVAGGAVYFRSGDGILYAVDIQSGQRRWEFTPSLPVVSSPAVADGAVYVATAIGGFLARDGYLYALDSRSGRQRWKLSTGGVFESSVCPTSPAVSGGLVYFGRFSLEAFDAKSGEKRWQVTPTQSGAFQATPAVSQGVVYFRINGYFGGIAAAGTHRGMQRWFFDTGKKLIITSPVVLHGVVYCASSDGRLLAVDGQNGTEEWSSGPGLAGHFSSPAVASGPEVYVGSDDGILHALHVITGNETWQFRTGAGRLSSPAVSNGVVYVGSDDGYLYAVK